MQIRVRQNTLTLIRTRYDPRIQRGRSLSLGSLPRDCEAVPEHIDARLTPAERNQLQAVLGRFRAERELVLQEEAARTLPQTLRRAICWYERQQRSAELAGLAKASRDAFSGLLAAMVRAGVGRTRKRRGKGTV